MWESGLDPGGHGKARCSQFNLGGGGGGGGGGVTANVISTCMGGAKNGCKNGCTKGLRKGVFYRKNIKNDLKTPKFWSPPCLSRPMKSWHMP